MEAGAKSYYQARVGLGDLYRERGNLDRAIRAYEKCGFRREGIIRHDLYVNGEYHDSIIMGILRDEFKKTANEE